MNDRVSVAARTVWNREPPEDNQRVVEIYHNWAVADARWDAFSRVWRNPTNNEVITACAYWRPKEVQS